VKLKTNGDVSRAGIEKVRGGTKPCIFCRTGTRSEWRRTEVITNTTNKKSSTLLSLCKGGKRMQWETKGNEVGSITEFLDRYRLDCEEVISKPTKNHLVRAT